MQMIRALQRSYAEMISGVVEWFIREIEETPSWILLGFGVAMAVSAWAINY